MCRDPWREGREAVRLSMLIKSRIDVEVGLFREPAAVFAAYAVVHLTAPESVVLVDEAIFADVIGAFGELPPQPFARINGHEPEAGGHGRWPAT